MKRIKLNFETFVKGPFNYYGFLRGNAAGIRGTFYKLCETPTPEQKAAYMEQYNNILWCSARAIYAPETTTSVLFIADRVIK